MPVDSFELAQHIQVVITQHTLSAKKPENATRIWDGKTPFAIHPVWCALTILTEQRLTEKTRRKGALTLLYHDLYEDTDSNLPRNLPLEVIAAIRNMTFPNGSPNWRDISRLAPDLRLFKLYDKTSNLMDPFERQAYELRNQQLLVRLLIDDVLQNYGELNITKLASALIPPDGY